MQIYVIMTDREMCTYTAFCEGGWPQATGESKEAAVGRLIMEQGVNQGFPNVVDVDACAKKGRD